MFRGNDGYKGYARLQTYRRTYTEGSAQSTNKFNGKSLLR